MTDIKTDLSKVRSPCVSICKLGSDSYCLGCFRHSSEISYWTTLSEEEKQKVVDECKLRSKKYLG